MPIEADTKDWTWVLDRVCAECGFDASAVSVDSLGSALRDDAEGWRHVLAGASAGVTGRPADDVWSPLEYACHVRDVHLVFAERVRLMLAEDDPEFANWDQDDAAVAGDYGAQQPAAVSRELVAAAGAVADLYDAVSGDLWERTGRRSNGSTFTVASLGRYHLHDVTHHLHDVGHDPARATVAAYDAHAAAYREGTRDMPEWILSLVEGFAAALPSGARVLEIGSGHGRDARALEAAGLSVRRTDITPAFVTMMRADGEDAEVLDPLHDELADPLRPGVPHDGVWASGSLLHVARADLPVVMARLAAVTRPGGALHLGVKEGEGDAWSTHGNVTAPRHFTFWRDEALRDLLTEAGWSVERIDRRRSPRGEGWLNVSGRRA